MIGLELFDGKSRGFDRGRCNGCEKSIGDGLLDPHSADVKAVHAAPLNEVFAGAMITRSRVAAAIVNMQTAATMTASDKALQQCRPLSHRAP